MAQYDSDRVDSTIDNLSVINGCSDSFTRVDVDKFKANSQFAADLIEKKIVPGLYVMVAILGLNFFMMCLFAMGCCEDKKSRRYSEQADEED